jgi:nucleoside 2-deoxyribosyltransferase
MKDKMKEYVYLAGPITGLTFDGAQDWRSEASKALDSDKIETLTPLRGKAHLRKDGVLHNGVKPYSQPENPITSSKGITRRDMNDTTRSSAVLANLSKTDKVSIGTVMELAWAYKEQIPLVVVMEKENVHQHAMVLECATYIVPTLAEGIGLVKFLLNDVKGV